jgi:Uma2 family endonuclease
MDDEMVITVRTMDDAQVLLRAPQLRAVLRRRRLFTVDEYHQLVTAGVLDEDSRLELIAGEIVQMAPIGPAHAGNVNRMDERLTLRFAGRAVVQGQGPLRIDRHSELQPDILLLRPRDDYYAAATPQPADVLLAVEVAHSSLAFDRSVKLVLYARAGIPEVWLLDVAARQLTAYREPTADGYGQARVIGRGDTIAPLAFPDEVFGGTELLG